MSWVELLDGILMSDGNLTIPGQCHYPRYQQTCKEPTFLQWVGSWLPTESRISGPHAAGKYQYWLLSTKTNAVYAPAYQHWYPQAKKRLPSNLHVTPELLLTEYLGDGFLLADAQKKLQHIEFGTYGFEEQSLIELLPKLKQENLDFRRLPNNALYLRGSQVKAFLKYIGSCPVPALSYKWSAIEVRDIPWRRIIAVEPKDTASRSGGPVTITLECGHIFCKPASKLRSGRTGMAICGLCEAKNMMPTPDALSAL